MIDIEIPNNWSPRKDQFPFWDYMQKGGKRAVVVAHRRWGKDDCALHFTAKAMVEKVGNYWHMLPKYEQARKVIWNAVNPKTGLRRIDEAFPIAIRKKTNEQEMKIELFNGSIWQLVGSDNYNQYVGSPPVGIVMSEYALSNPMSWAYISPILEENGGWAMFIYTARGNNHGKTLYNKAKLDDRWFAYLVTAEDTKVFSIEQLNAIKADYTQLFGIELGTSLYEQEYMCSFEGAQMGAYYSKQMARAEKEGRIRDVAYDNRHEVYTAWDLGVDDSTTIWFFQVIGNSFYFIDYYENTSEGLAHYAKVLKDKNYVYGDHYLPHDGDSRKLGETAETPREILERLGIDPIVIVKRPKDSFSVMKGIDAVRSILDRCWFDKTRCVQGINALESYHAEYDETNKKLHNIPKHDWTSHGADAMRCMAVGYMPKQDTVSVLELMQRG